MRLHVGCAMWNLKPWVGRFVPPSLPPQERLKSYAQWCNAVEGNTTFYAVPKRSAVESWARQTDPGFRFVVKLPKSITHERRLNDVEVELATFLDAIEPLGPRVHALWIQLPGSFTPSDLDGLAGFLARLPRTHRYAVEVRHRAFFDNPSRLERVLSAVDAEWVPFDTTAFFKAQPTSDAEREAWTAKPRMPQRLEALTERPIIRYLGRDDVSATVEGWKPLHDKVVAWLREGRSPTVFIHTPDNADAPMLARRFHDEVRSRVPSLDPLPEPAREEQPTLF